MEEREQFERDFDIVLFLKCLKISELIKYFKRIQRKNLLKSKFLSDKLGFV